ncbi:MAG TPA: transcriptional regulator GcvA [Bosea sp. (in: a-proteobacteria)]|jgi:LysR family glycine cleavage system transcriptional activator|uniref:transcriptional regulator GcvA n=1 Tax=Bosea sp. (in: a-proteobacteria) TaxID=1871050 RepID=UPI002E1358A5|nr:transcriptional regulator GcvA [Bosea sp. (in: a-proteobacteria)]
MPVPSSPLKLPPLAAVRVFEAAARHQNFTRAADELGMTQAAVSYQIRLLEDRVGAALFVRQPRQVVLTPLGQRLAGPVTKALRDIGTVFGEICEENQTVLTISALQTVAITWLSPRLARFQVENPQFDVRVRTSQHLVDFATEAVDMAVRYGPGGWPGVTAEKLFDCHYAPLCTPELRERLGLREPADLLNAPLLSPGDTKWRTWFADLGIDSWSPAGRTTMTLDMQAMSIQAALQGHGVALAAPELFAYDIAAGRLTFAVGHAIRSDWAYWVVYPQERQRERKIRLFRDWILAEAEAARMTLARMAGSRGMTVPAP